MTKLQCDQENREHLKYVRNVYCLLTNHVPKLQAEHCYKSGLIEIKITQEFAGNDTVKVRYDISLATRIVLFFFRVLIEVFLISFVQLAFYGRSCNSNFLYQLSKMPKYFWIIRRSPISSLFVILKHVQARQLLLLNLKTKAGKRLSSLASFLCKTINKGIRTFLIVQV